MIEVIPRNNTYASPLRYPGGKASLSDFFETAIKALGLDRPVYLEPYAGGVGAGLKLLLKDVVSKVIINDLDPAIYACWRSMLKETDEFLRLIQSTPLSVNEWKHQREIYKDRKNPFVDTLELGFATFYLNRTSRSGVLGAGVIGGLEQRSKDKIDARFDKQKLSKRIELLASYGRRIEVTQKDGAAKLKQYLPKENVFAYVDPPYVEKGSSLYMSSFAEEDHVNLAKVLNGYSNSNWILTYDVNELVETLYRARYTSKYKLLYSVHLKGTKTNLKRTDARELMILSNTVSDSLLK